MTQPRPQQSDYVFEPIDIFEFENVLTLYKKYPASTEFDCPVCLKEGKLSVKNNDGNQFTAFCGCTHSDIRRQLKPESRKESPERAAQRETKRQEKVEQERARKEALKSSEQKNTEFLATLSQRTLSNPHRQDMLDRGYTPEMIELTGAKTFTFRNPEWDEMERNGSTPEQMKANGVELYVPGRGMPVRDYAGKIVGVQRAGSGPKPWKGINNRLKETDEIPLGVVYPQTAPQFDKKLGGSVYYCESPGDKLWVTANNYGAVTIGSSNIGSQPIDLARTILGIAAKFGWTKTYHVLMPDGGAIVNRHVMACYAKLQKQLKDLGHELMVGWWSQYEKNCGDIDEISSETVIKHISWDKFLRIAEDYREYKSLTKLTLNSDLLKQNKDPRFVTETIYSEQYVQPFTPVPGAFTFVSSPCATGKTEVLIKLIEDHLAKYPKARIFYLTHLNTLRETIQGRLNIDDWRIGFKDFEDGAINDFQKIAICSDSLNRLNLDSIPRNSLWIVDEGEAGLQHVSNGGTLQNQRKTDAQSRYGAALERVLIANGSVIFMEDCLTDVSIDAVHLLTGSQFDRILIKNDVQSKPWNVSMGQGDLSSWLSEILNRLKDGERLFVPNTSQEFGEALARLVCLLQPELKDKIVRLDRKTTSEYQDLMRDPVKYLTDDRDVRLFICSPTIQSGFNIALWGYFSAVMMKASNLSTRAIIQMLNRVRDNCERLIYTKMRGVGANSSRSVEKLKEQQRLLANEVSLATGYGRIPETLETTIWNHTAAQFEVRDNLSTCYLHDYLFLNLKERGHNITEPNWLGAEGWGCELEDMFKEIKHQIKVDDNKILFDAKPTELTLVQARNILGSSNQPWAKQQQARKTILWHRAAQQFLSEEALFVLWTDCKGQYWNQCEFAWLMLNPEVARVIDRQKMAEMQGKHQIYKDAPKTSLKVDLLQPVVNDLLDLASGRDYDKLDPAVARINEWCLKNSFQAFKYFGINFNSEIVDSHGCVRNTAIANVNKILRVIGFSPKSTRQVGSKKDRMYIYAVENTDCEHRALVYKAMAITHKETIADDENVKSAGQTVAALMIQPLAEARTAIAEFKKYGHWNARTMQTAVELLDQDNQDKWSIINNVRAS